MSTIYCIKCGSQIDTAASFCPFCGEAIPRLTNQCRYCGSEVRSNSKYCPKCGMSIIDEKKQSLGSIDYEKCPYCGEFLPSGMVNCPSCGNEIRGRKTAISLKEFTETLTATQDINMKIEDIKTFPIPNNKEDISDFMYLAVSNFRPDYYLANKNTEGIDNAWYVKIKQCYEKSINMFVHPEDKKTITDLYKNVNSQIERHKKKYIFMIILGIALIFLSLITMSFASASNVFMYLWEGMLAAGIAILVINSRNKNNKIGK